MHQAQGAQPLDQGQFARLEVMEFLIAVHEFGQLCQPLLAIAGQEHPEILHGRAMAAVVEVDDVVGLIATEQVARVAVAVQADDVVADALEEFVEAQEQVARHGFIGGQQALGNEVAGEQGVQGGMAVALDVQRLAVLEGPTGTHRMQAAEQLAQTMQLVEIARLRRATATAGKECEAKAGMGEQRLAVALQGRDHGHLALFQFGGKGVFFENGGIRPAIRTVELGDQRSLGFDADLIDAILVAVEGQYPGIAEIAQAFDGVDDEVGTQIFERMRHGALLGHGGRWRLPPCIREMLAHARAPWRRLERYPLAGQAPITPPSSRVMTITEERG